MVPPLQMFGERVWLTVCTTLPIEISFGHLKEALRDETGAVQVNLNFCQNTTEPRLYRGRVGLGPASPTGPREEQTSIYFHGGLPCPPMKLSTHF